MKYADPISAQVAQHLTNTVFVDRALIVQSHKENEIPDSAAALQFTSAAGLNSGSNSGVVSQVITAVGGAQVISTIDPRLQALGLPQYPPLPANMDPSKVEEIRRTIYVGNLDSKITAEEALKFFNQIGEVKYVRMAGDETQPTRFAFIEFTEQASVANALQYNGVTLGGRPLKINHSNNAIVKPHTSKNPEAAQKEIEETMKRVREAQHMITAQIDPSMKLDKVAEEIEQKISRISKSRSKSRDRKRDRTRSRSRDRRERNRRRSRSRSREKRRSTSRDRKSHRVRESPKRRSPPRRRSRERRSRSRNRHVRRSPVRSYKPRYSPSRTKERREIVDHRRRSRTRSRSRERRDDRREPRRAKESPKRHRNRSPADVEGPVLPPSDSPLSSPRPEGPVTPPEDRESNKVVDRLMETETPPKETVYKKRTSRSPGRRRRSRSRERRDDESRRRPSRRDRSRSRDEEKKRRHRTPVESTVTRNYDEEEKGFDSSPQNGSRNKSPHSSD